MTHALSFVEHESQQAVTELGTHGTFCCVELEIGNPTSECCLQVVHMTVQLDSWLSAVIKKECEKAACSTQSLIANIQS